LGLEAPGITTGCLDDETLIAFSEGRLSEARADAVGAHVDGCAMCFVLLTEVERAARSSAHADTISVERPRVVPWHPPPVVDELHIEAPIGRGAGGQVFRAIDTRLDRPVAIKFLAVEPGAGTRERFALEARALARLSHPNVVTVYRAGEVAGRPFLVSELVRGKSLNRVAKPMAWREALEIATGLVRGLGAAHRAGVLHRDIKPANAILGDDGTVKLLDFGLAKLIQGGGIAPVSQTLATAEASETPTPMLRDDISPTLTTTGAVLGTPLYMAPEAWLGAAPTPQMDIYSMGALVYELLVGAPPHMGATLSDVRKKALAGDVRMPTLDAPPSLVAVIERCLRRDPDARYCSAETLLLALERIRPMAVARRWRNLGLVAGGLALVGATFAFVSLRASRHGAPAWRPEVVDHQPVFEENADTPMFSPDGKWLIYSSNRNGGWRLYRQPRDSSAAAVPITEPGWGVGVPEWSHDSRFIYLSDNMRVFRMPVEGGSRELIANWVSTFAVCGDRLALTRPSAPDCGNCQRILVHDGKGDRELVRVRGSLGRIACDREGKALVYSIMSDVHLSPSHERGDLWLVALDGGSPRALTSDGLNAYPVFHPDGKSIIFASDRSGHTNLWELPVDGGAPEQLTFGEGPDVMPDVSPDGREVIFDIDNTSMPLFAYAKGTPRRWLTRALEDVDTVVPTRDGKELIVGVIQGHGHRIVSYALPSGDERIITEGHAPALSADERELVFARREGAITKILAMPRDGGPERLVATLPETVRALAVGADGIVDISLGRAWNEFGVRAVPLGGGTPARELDVPWGLVLANGDDRLGVRFDEKHQVAFLRHGKQPWSQARELPIALRDSISWYPDGHALVYWTGADVHRYDLASGRDSTLVESLIVRGLGLSASADGTTVYAVDSYSHVRRALITNYWQRRRPGR
jgi:hypothetical protein